MSSYFMRIVCLRTIRMKYQDYFLRYLMIGVIEYAVCCRSDWHCKVYKKELYVLWKVRGNEAEYKLNGLAFKSKIILKRSFCSIVLFY